jgi:biotin carboxylase
LEITKLAKLLGLRDGLLHTQVITNQSEFWLIECMRRCPGDLYNKLIEYSTGLDYVDLFLRPFLGEPFPELACLESKPFMRHTISSCGTSTFMSISAPSTLASQGTWFFPLKSSGDLLEAAPGDKAAIVFIEAASEKQMIEVTPQLGAYFQIDRLGPK